LILDVKTCYQLKSDVTEETLKLERRLLAGPDIDAYESLSIAFKEEIKSVKSSLDAAAKGVLTEDGFTEVDTRLVSLIGVLKVIHQLPLAAKVEAQRNKIRNLQGGHGELKVAALAELADALLQVELACDQFVKGEVSGEDNIVGAGHFIEAKIVLYDEIQSGLNLTKRAMAAFLETGDKLHLSNIRPALDGVRGAWIFLGHLKASKVISSAAEYFDLKVLNTDAGPDEARLEVLADALTSIEYYAETLSHSDGAGGDILNLAIKSMGQLGFKI
jgi:hypothetical protein